MSFDTLLQEHSFDQLKRDFPHIGCLETVNKKNIVQLDLFKAFDYTDANNWIAVTYHKKLQENNFNNVEIFLPFPLNSVQVTDLEYNYTFYKACLNSDVESIKFLQEYYGLHLYREQLFIIKTGNFVFKIPPYICIIALSGDLEKFKQFENEEYIKKSDENIQLRPGLLEFALHSRSVDMVRHIVQRYKPEGEKIVPTGNSEIDDFLQNNGYTCVPVPLPRPGGSSDPDSNDSRVPNVQQMD